MNGIDLRSAILRTLIYADVFDYALTRAELQRYLIGQATSIADVAAALDDDSALHREVSQMGDWIYLAGRDGLVDVRRQRQNESARLWKRAQVYGAMIERLPFVRLVGVTGALAMNCARSDDDVDLFILVQPGRLWFCRLLVLTIVKLAALQGTDLCPNFLLDTDHLRLAERNIFTAHEIAQMVPLTRTAWYDAFLAANDWAMDYLPNAFGGLRSLEAPMADPPTALSWLLSHRLLDPIERWEMIRKRRRLLARYEREGGSVSFSAHECRGHFNAHDVRALAAYTARLASYWPILEPLAQVSA